MRALIRLFVAALIATPVAAAARSACAQGSDPELPPRWKSLQTLPALGSPERRALVDDLESGRVDPLALITHLVPRAAALPAGAVYQGPCSRARGGGVAIFALGGGAPAEVDESARAVAGTKIRSDADGPAKLAMFQNMARMANAMNTAPEVQRARAFYTRQGAHVGTVTTYTPLDLAPAGAEPTLHVVLWGANPQRGGGAHQECAGLGAGPVMTLELK